MSTKKEKCCENLCYCGEDTTIGHFKGVEGCCHQSESIDLDEIDNKITDLIQRLPFEKRGEIWTLIYESRKQAITTAVAKDRELGNPYNSVSTWKEIGKNRGYWGFFKDQVISAREKELVEEVEKKSFRGFAPYEQDYLIKKEDVLSILKH